jgi:starch synthase (maltosyl-transferring)
MTGGRGRVAIENIRPEIDGGRFPAKRVVGERVIVEADIFADGHDTSPPCCSIAMRPIRLA